MKDTQILSTFQEWPPEPVASAAPPAPLFNACQVGVALRAVLFVELVVAVAALFGTANFFDWLIRLSLYTGGALPATVIWLVVACAARRPLLRLPPQGQYVAAIVLGALSGLYGCGLLVMSGLLEAPPWLASAASGALLAGSGVGALALRERGKTPAATTARLAELQSRIRPHFLFNTLNSAIALVRAEPARAEALLEDLSDLFRHALADQGESVTLAEEIALARHYLEIEQVRFGERLRLEWALDPAADAARLPPLLLQPLLENAVRHGVEPSAEGAQIRISTQRRGSNVVIKVTNTVPAGPGAQGHGVALNNVRDRLRLLHDVEGQFRHVLKDGVFQVRIEVPA
ncbi:MAG: sensor histidine kinase [Curvibacter sp. PD_MW3]|nr:MAG: sensor histidine kinase [Curvibacter sp. PD_MW3]